MKKLILVRHAKSSWEAPLNDFDRPLTSRGINDAHLVSSHIVPLLPSTFICWSSTAQRARETALIFAQNIGCPVKSIIFDNNLYTFERSALEKVIKGCNDEYENVILFGHNEAITNFVNKFGTINIDNVSTSGVVFLTFQSASWRDISKGITERVVFPRDLK